MSSNIQAKDKFKKKKSVPTSWSTKAGIGTAGNYKSSYLGGDLLVLVAPGISSFCLA